MARGALTSAAIQQPYFLPWIGYFGKLAAVDKFVFLDDAAFRRNHVSRSGVIAGNNVRQWLKVPVGASQGAPLNTIRVPADTQYVKRVVRAMELSYARAAFFEQAYPHLETIVREALTPGCTLAEANVAIIRRLLKLMGGRWPTLEKASELAPPLERTARVVELCRAVGASRLLVGDGGFFRAHDVGIIGAAGIAVDVLPYGAHHPVYRQMHRRRTGHFVAGLSVVDAILNIGLHETRDLIDRRNGTLVRARDAAATTVTMLTRATAERWASLIAGLDDPLAHGLEHWSREQLLRDLPRKWELSWIAARDDRPVGYRVVSTAGPLKDHVHTHRFVIGAQIRGHGIGRLLLDSSDAELRANGFAGATAWIHTDNAPSQKLFRALGYVRTGVVREPNELWVTAW